MVEMVQNFLECHPQEIQADFQEVRLHYQYFILDLRKKVNVTHS